MRSGFIIMPSMTTSEPGTISARHQREGAGRRIGRHDDVARVQVRPALERDSPAVRPVRRAGDAGAEIGEHLFRVVARGLRLDDGGAAGRVEPGEQDGGFELRRGHGRAVFDRARARSCRAG